MLAKTTTMDFEVLQALRAAASEFLDESDFRYIQKREEFHCICEDQLADGLTNRLATTGWQLKRTLPNARSGWSRLIFAHQKNKKT